MMATSIRYSRHMLAWMNCHKLSLAISAGQQGRLVLLGLDQQGVLASSACSVTGSRMLAPANNGNGFYLAAQQRIWRFENALGYGQLQDGGDRYYLPQASTATGDLDVRDLAVDADGRLNVLDRARGIAKFTPQGTLKSVWKPAPASAPETRWNLTGMALREGRPAYACATSQVGGGVLFDIAADAVALGGMVLPQAPRWYRGKLWLADAGSGFFGHADFASGRFVPLCFSPGYIRGLVFYADYAVLACAASDHGSLAVVDLHAGEVVHWMQFDDLRDMHGVSILAHTRRPLVAAAAGSVGAAGVAAGLAY